MLNTLKKYRATLFDDMLAGLTGAVAGAPQAMGFAILAGVSPLYGLYAAFITSVVSSLLSSSQLLVFAPTNALALVAGSAIMVAPPDKQLDVLFLLSILTGIFLLLIGLFRLGNMTRFVSNAVMTGFITGAGLLIMLGQLHHLNNYDNTESSIPLVRVWDWFSHLHLSDYHTTMIGVASIVIIWGLHHTRFKSYATLFAMIVLTIFISVAGWDDVPDVRELSEIPR
ncbi:MAG: SulP family inorganic anion transporter, partial [Chloroflexota bacterium]